MQKRGKRVLSLLLAFTMVLGLLGFSGTGSAYAYRGIDEILADMNLDPDTRTLDLSGTDLIGLVDIDDLLDDFPGLFSVDLSDTYVTMVTPNPSPIMVNYANTFYDINGKRLVYNGNPLHFNKSQPEAITVGDVFAAIDMVNVGSGVELGDLIQFVRVSVRDSSQYEFLTSNRVDASDKGNIVLSADSLSGVNFATGDFLLIVDLFFYNDGYVYNNGITMDFEVASEKLVITSNMEEDALTLIPYAYAGDTVVLTVTQLDAAGDPMDMDEIENYTISFMETSPTIGLLDYDLQMQRIDGANGLVVTIDPDELTAPGTYDFSIGHVDDRNKWESVGFTVRPYQNDADEISLLEYNPLDPSRQASLGVTAQAGGGAVNSRLYVNQSSSIASRVSENVGQQSGAYEGPTWFIVLENSSSTATPLPGHLAGMVKVAADDGLSAVVEKISYTGTIDGITYTDESVAAVKVSAGSVAVPHYGDVTITVENPVAANVEYVLKCEVVEGNVTGYNVYRVPARLASQDLESIINGPAAELAALGIVKMVEKTKQPDGSFTVTWEEAEVVERSSVYLVSTVQFGENAVQNVTPADAVVHWYDHSEPSLTFDNTPAEFAGGSFTGEVEELWGTKVLVVKAKSYPGADVTARVGLYIAGDPDGSINRIQIKLTEKDFDRYTFGDKDRNELTEDEIPIGLFKDYRIMTIYDNGEPDDDDVDLDEITIDDSGLVHFAVSVTEDNQIRIQAPDRGGVDNGLAGTTETLVVVHEDGQTAQLELTIGNPVITGYKYYVDMPEITTLVNPVSTDGVLTTDTMSQGQLIPGETDENSAIELERGLFADYYIVPVFSNEDMNEAAEADWTQYRAYMGDFDFTSLNLTHTESPIAPGFDVEQSMDYSYNSEIAPYVPDYDADGLQLTAAWDPLNAPSAGDVIAFTTKPTRGTVRLSQEFIAENNGGDTAAAYAAYDAATGEIGARLPAVTYFKITEPLITAIEVENYKGKVDRDLGLGIWYDYDAVTPNTPVPVEVGEETEFRVKIAYSDSHTNDKTSFRAAVVEQNPTATSRVFIERNHVHNLPLNVDDYIPFTLFSDGFLFMANSTDGLVPQYGYGYESQYGPVATGVLGGGRVEREAEDLAGSGLVPLDVVRSYLFTYHAMDYIGYLWDNSNIPEPMPSLNSYLNYNFGLEGEALHNIAMNEMERIQIMVIDEDGADVTEDMNASWSEEFPGIFTVNPTLAGTYTVLFYENYKGEMTAIGSLDGLDDIYTFELLVSPTVENLVLVGGGDVYTDSGSYIFSADLPGSFHIYPFLVDVRFAGDAATEALGFVKGRAEATKGFEYMYVEDFPDYQNYLSFDYNLITGDDTNLYVEWDEQEIDGKEVIALKVSASSECESEIWLDWNQALAVDYQGAHSSYDVTTGLLTDSSGHAELELKVSKPLLVYDISVSAAKVEREGVWVEVTDEEEAQIGEEVRVDVLYRLSDGTLRGPFADELTYLNYEGGGSFPGVLRVNPGAPSGNTNPGKSEITADAGVGLNGETYLYFTPYAAGDYRYYFTVMNTNGRRVPDADNPVDLRNVTFTVGEQLPEDTITIAYRELVEIQCQLDSGAAVYTSDNTSGLLDEAALAAGYLRMSRNEDGEESVVVKDEQGNEKLTITVTMRKINSTVSVSPASSNTSPYLFVPGQRVQLQEKESFADGTSEYYAITRVTYSEGLSDFLEVVSGNDVVAPKSTAVSGLGGIYSTVSELGRTGTFFANYNGSGSYTYPQFQFDSYDKTLYVGGASEVLYVTATNAVSFTADDIILEQTGTGAVSVERTTFGGSVVTLTMNGVKSGTVTLTAVNGNGDRTAPVTIQVLDELTIQKHPVSDGGAPGADIYFSAVAQGGDGAYSYQWEISYNGSTWQTLVEDGNYLNTNGSTLTIADIDEAMDGYQFRCVVTDGTGAAVTSRGAALTVDNGFSSEINVSKVTVAGVEATAGLEPYSFDVLLPTDTDLNLITASDFVIAYTGGETTDRSSIGRVASEPDHDVWSFWAVAANKVARQLYTVNLYVQAPLSSDTSVNSVSVLGVAHTSRSGSVFTVELPYSYDPAAIDPLNPLDDIEVETNDPAAQVKNMTATDAACLTWTFDVEAQDGSSDSYTIQITMLPASSETGVNSIAIATPQGPATVTVDPQDHTTYAAELPFGSDPAALTAGSFTIVLKDTVGAIHTAPAATDATNTTWTFTVTAEDNSTETYTIHITVGTTPAPTYTIGGVVTDTDSVTPAPLPGALVTLLDSTGSPQAMATASTPLGAYSLTVADGSYVLIATMAGHQPQVKAVRVEGNDVTANFALVPDSTMTGGAIVYGQITDSTTKAALGNATVTLRNGTAVTGSGVTDSDGYYIIYDVPANATYGITAARTGYGNETGQVSIGVADTIVRHDMELTANQTTGPSGGGGGGSGNSSSLTAEINLSPATMDVEGEATATVSRLLRDGSTVSIANNARYTWTVRNEEIAVIDGDKDGHTVTLKGLSPGTATVSVSVVNSGQTYTGSVTLTVRGDEEEEFVPGGGFADVPDSFWGYDAITYLAENGIVNGYEDDTFRPDNAILRNEFAVMLTNSRGWSSATSAQISSAAAHFADWNEIPSWAQNAWALAYANNIINGTLGADGQYYAEGGRNISRQEVSVIFANLLGTGVTGSLSFSDAAEIAAWAAAAVQECVAEGLISGYEDNTFRPTANITRAESAAIFYRYLTVDRTAQQPADGGADTDANVAEGEQAGEPDAADGQTANEENPQTGEPSGGEQAADSQQ